MDCETRGFHENKFGITQLPLVLGKLPSELRSNLGNVEAKCRDYLRGSRLSLKPLWKTTGGNVVYARVSPDVLVREEPGKAETDMGKHKKPFKGHVALHIESLYVRGRQAFVQMKVREVLILDKEQSVWTEEF